MVTISEKAKAIMALTDELSELQQQANSINDLLERTWDEFFVKTKQISMQHSLIITKQAEIYDAISKIKNSITY